MRKPLIVVMMVLLVGVGTLFAQVPLAGPPLNVDFGLGGGLSAPTGKLADSSKQGYHLGGKVRLSGFMPLSIIGFANYNSIPEKNTDKKDTQWMLGAGLEYAIPSAMVKPYFGVDGMVNFFKNEGSGTSSYNRIGIGMGGGILFAVPAFGSFDVSAKYQMMNLIGKEDKEEDMAQVAVNLSVMFSL